jgi:hypothetical protein
MLVRELIARQLIPLACDHIFLKSRREVTVVPFNHANAGAHLHSKSVYVHSVVEQSESRIGVAQAVQGPVLPRA